ncbi:transcription initiation factor TFIID subunit 4-like [Nelusetta ayraudi]|uniref:transcription initiation factor TFIID subunit 4-like n=1 Tax=Nelusetta ayraudi TaxID=303726 RepID=UPI003F72D8F1
MGALCTCGGPQGLCRLPHCCLLLLTQLQCPNLWANASELSKKKPYFRFRTELPDSLPFPFETLFHAIERPVVVTPRPGNADPLLFARPFYFYAEKPRRPCAHAYILRYYLHNGLTSKMAGASDPLEDMLFNEVDEKAVSDLVGSLESQLGDRKTPAASFAHGKRDGAAAAGSQLSGKMRDQVGSLEQPQQGHPKAGLSQEPGANEAIPAGKSLPPSTSAGAVAAAATGGAGLQTVGAPPPTISPAPGPVTLNTQPAAASFQRAAVLGPSAVPGANVVPAAAAAASTAAAAATTATTTSGSPSVAGLQNLNGGAGSVKLVNSAAAVVVPPPAPVGTVISAVTAGSSTIIAPMAPQPTFPGTQSSVASVTLQRHPSPVTSVAQNGVEGTDVQQQQQQQQQLVTPGAPSPAASASQVMNHSNPLMHGKVLVPGQPVSGSSVILANSPPPVAVQSTLSQPPTATGSAVVKPAVNGLVQQPTVAVVRPPGAPVMATAIQQQRAGLVASTTRAAAPQQPLAVRPQQQQPQQQQQTTIQLPPGFSMSAGMVLVRTETGQLVMVPQHVLAQAQAKMQQGQTVANIAQRPATPTTAAAIRVSTATTAPQTVRLASPTQTRMVQPTATNTVQAISVAPGGTTVTKITANQKAPTVMTAVGAPLAKPAGVPAAAPLSSTPAASPAVPTNRVAVVSQEMQENVKKCKNFLSTLIKLASHNSPSPDTSKNVKALVQDLLDAKIEPEEFTTRLQAELKSSPQPYLIPFLKKSLPALRQSLLSSQQSLATAPGAVAPPVAVAPGSAPVTTAAAATTIRPRMPVTPAGSAVRLNPPLTNTLAVARTGVQTVQNRTPVVFSQTVRPQGALIRGPTTIIGKSPIHLAAQANQKKLSDPGGGTFRDDDDINDVASMAGVNLNEENARILATSSELVGTKIRSCKDESFLPTGLLHRRVLDTAKKLGVSEVSLEVVNFISHATESRLRSLLEKVSAVAQHRTDVVKDEENHEQTTDVRSQLRFFEQLERMEKQRKDEQEREILLKAAKSRARQEDPEQARLKQKAKEMQQQELAQMRQRDANLTALAAIGPRKKRKMDSPGGSAAGTEAASGSGSGSSSAAAASSSRQQLRQRITRVNLRDFIFCLEQEPSTARSLLLYKALLK